MRIWVGRSVCIVRASRTGSVSIWLRSEGTLIGPEAPADVRTHANSAQSLADRVEELIRQAKLDRKEALKLAARERGLTRRAAYDEIVSEKK